MVMEWVWGIFLVVLFENEFLMGECVVVVGVLIWVLVVIYW